MLPPHRAGSEQMKRTPTLQFLLQGRLERFAVTAELRANEVGRGPRRDDLMRKARQARTASEIHEWLLSPNLQAPT